MAKQSKRIPITENAQTIVLTKSRRRCCLCFWLEGIDELAKGQIAHLDQDNSNADIDNLCFLCLNHHDEYDSSTRQSKGLRESEVRHWREELYREMSFRFRDYDVEDLRHKKMFEYLESVAGDLLSGLRFKLRQAPLVRLIVAASPGGTFSGPRKIFEFRTNQIPDLIEKMELLHNSGLLRHDEDWFYWLTEPFAEYLRNS